MNNNTAATPEPLDAQVRRVYPTLSATERRLADVLLAQREALLGYSATELAQLAGASKATAARFFRRLGYADFNAFRAQLRAQVNPAPLHRLNTARAPKQGGGRLQAHTRQDIATLERLGTDIDAATLQQAVATLARARRLWIAGYRNAHAVAFYAQALLHQVRPQAQLLNESAGRETELLADVDARDAVLAVDLRRRTRRLPVLLRALRATGAQVVLLTDAPMSELEPEAQVVLRCPTHASQLFDSYVAPVSLVNFLASELAARASTATRERLARIEELHAALADLETATESERKKSR
jgi:DNA-binding MurR/RpiR family transcriptional regulator